MERTHPDHAGVAASVPVAPSRGAVAIGRAMPSERESVRALLVSVGLPASDVGAVEPPFLVARSGGTVVGCIDLERFGAAALLRSFAVLPAWRRRGIGRALHEAAVESARAEGVAELYLLTTTVERSAARRGFARVARDEVPADVRGAQEFRTLCPASAACMRLSLRRAR
jgi:N-acetylglutamate synthase-like GNAT family acetyltransferase